MKTPTNAHSWRSPAFTLVELIVVIAIVWILSTVGFVAYSGYLTGARDSNRYSQLTKLSDSLQVYSTTKSLPLPDDHIEITASGTTIAYQGYAATDVLETIDYTNGGKDPKDESYFTYYLTKDRKSLQLLAFMEETAAVNSIFQGYKSHAADYRNRFPVVYGDELWIILTSDSLGSVPIQEYNAQQGFFDIFEVNQSPDYVFYISNTSKISWSWSVALWKIINSRADLINNKYLASADESLIAFYDMETLSHSGWQALLKDFSSKWNDLNIIGDISVGWVSWVKGRSTDFSRSSWYFEGQWFWNQILTGEMSVHIVFRDSAPFEWIYKKLLLLWDSSNNFLMWVSKWPSSESVFCPIYGLIRLDGAPSHTTICSDVDLDWDFTAITLTYSEAEGLKIYVNPRDGKWYFYFWENLDGDLLSKDLPLRIGYWYANEYFDGIIDEVRIYNRVLWEEEVRKLYFSALK